MYSLACGKDRSLFPSFAQDLDGFLSDYRKGSGYTGEEEQSYGYQGNNNQRNNEQSSLDLDTLLEVENEYVLDESKKKSGKPKFKEGRSGILSAFMQAMSGNSGDEIVFAWNAGDVEKLMEKMGDVTEKVVDKLIELHPNPIEPKEETEETSE
jgi:hypothetical protein